MMLSPLIHEHTVSLQLLMSLISLIIVFCNFQHKSYNTLLDWFLSIVYLLVLLQIVLIQISVLIQICSLMYLKIQFVFV